MIVDHISPKNLYLRDSVYTKTTSNIDNEQSMTFYPVLISTHSKTKSKAHNYFTQSNIL